MKQTVTKKLYFGFFSIIAILILMGLLSHLILKDIDDRYKFLIDDRVHKVTLIKDLMNNQKDQTIGLRGYLLYGSEQYLVSYENAKGLVEKSILELEGQIQSSEGQEILSRLKKSITDLNESTKKSIEAKSNGENEKALELAQEGRQQVEALNGVSNELIDFQNKSMDATLLEIEDKVAATEKFILITVIVSFLLGSVIAYFISRSITNPINLVRRALNEIAAGNLMFERVKVKNRDEIGTMVQDLNRMVEDLRDVVTKVNESALEVASQSQELSASSEESTAASQMLAQIAQTNASGSEKQLSAIDEMSTVVTEMTQGINQIADSGLDMLSANQQAEDFIEKGLKTIEVSSNQMNELNVAMHEISGIVDALSEKSNEISNITNIINDIADQTNLLALNAAIEAARAGEAGKGFAVVADEVRRLAEQSKDSSSQIAKMISDIQHGINEAIFSIDKGNRVVDSNLASTAETLKSFNLIEESSNGVTEKIHSVASATNQLKLSADGILTAIKEVQVVAKESSNSSNEASAATEEQVATMEQISASAQSLSGLSEQLQSIVATFKIH